MILYNLHSQIKGLTSADNTCKPESFHNPEGLWFDQTKIRLFGDKLKGGVMPNFLPFHRKTQVLNALVEGASICSISRMTGVNKRTILRLLCEAGEKAKEIMDRELVNVKARFIQCDEIWAFVGKKQKQCTEEEKREGLLGDQYIWVAMDSDSKLVVSYRIGKRTQEYAESIMKDLAYRIPNRFQLSTDAFKGYFDAVDRVFGTDVDYGTIHKNFAEDILAQRRYSPPQVVSVSLEVRQGFPIRKRISTSHVERQNLTMRMNMRRLTRLTNAFSKKLSNLEAAVALHFYWYDFCRIHQTLRVTPAMAAGITRKLWSWEGLWNSVEERKAA